MPRVREMLPSWCHARVGHPDEVATVGLARVELVYSSPPVTRIHEPVVDKRVRLSLGTVLAGVLHPTERQRPDHPKLAYVVAVDRSEFREALRAVVAVHEEPVLRLVLRVDQPLLVHCDRILAANGRRPRRDPKRDNQQCAW